MSVRWGLTEETICGLMNAAPWPLSVGAFNASVRAGLLSSKTLAKADFFTGNRASGPLEGGCVCMCVYVCVAGDWILTCCCTFSSKTQPTPQPVPHIYHTQRVAGHHSVSKHDSLELPKHTTMYTHIYVTSTHITSDGGTGCQDPPAPSLLQRDTPRTEAGMR